MQTLGVLGGLGAASSALFHRRVVEACQRAYPDPATFPRVLYDGAPVGLIDPLRAYAAEATRGPHAGSSLAM
ncbi:MAG: hypothetical protein JKP92_06240 [Alphaproteobacteria bacterium]|jgi:hypothetical protein|nr:hypothetical protein [Alphaproteobacteria bacterium]